ncbi:hypothetical protein C7999DRAFT_42574 [Corynascus novoguineensis]|uniref:Epidermal growth factor receptor-like transmembrane-juxtamembrane segment domain-containing protein n=1 Tax=Corynascus novoguineensis TaxID=1126955 RepID=A0AAN7CRK7_9PEZI|nr:hypothetical protein C7999DRAFT_42574 [Corynascus novoguineensis]
MAVKSLGWLAAAAVWLPSVAGMAREQVFDRAPLQTLAPLLREVGVDVSPLAVTAAPVPRALQKRSTQTCGYVDGDLVSSYVCAHSEAECLYDDRSSAVGCCLTESCEVYAGCLPYKSSKATKTYDSDKTLYCSNSDLPSCAVFSYADKTGSIAGYTIHTCDSVSTTYTMFFRPTDTSSSSRSTTTSESLSESPESTTGSSPTGTDSDSSPAETSGDSDSDSDSSTPVGPIVGGVVGGVAALALIGLGVFFLVRRKKQNGPNPAGLQGGPTGFMGGPPGGPSGYANVPSPPNSAMGPIYSDSYDPLQNSSAYAGSIHQMQNIPPSPHAMNPSPAGSPAPTYQYPHQPQQQMHAMGGPPPPHGMGMGMGMGGMGTPPPQHHGFGTPPPPMGMGTPTPPPPHNGYNMPYPSQELPKQQQMYMQAQPVELPTQKGDGQVHELS